MKNKGIFATVGVVFALIGVYFGNKNKTELNINQRQNNSSFMVGFLTAGAFLIGWAIGLPKQHASA